MVLSLKEESKQTTYLFGLINIEHVGYNHRMKKTNNIEHTHTLEQSSDKKVNKLRLSKAKIVVIGLICLLLVAIITYLIYSYTKYSELQSKLNQTNNELLTKTTQTNEAVSSLKKEVATLKSAYETAKVESSPNDLVKLEGVLSAFHLDTVFMSSVGNNVTYGKDQRGYNTAYIEVAVINNGTSDGYISSGEFKLKDADDITYQMDNNELRNRVELEGKQLLQSQVLAQGERTVGLIAFQVPSGLNEFKLHFKNNIYDVRLR